MMPAPRNWRRIVDDRISGAIAPQDPVIVSFVGDTVLKGPHLYADPGIRYDWTPVAGANAHVVVKPGIDVAHALRSIFEFAQFYPTLYDFEQQIVASIVDARPLKLLPFRRGSERWAQLFL